MNTGDDFFDELPEDDSIAFLEFEKRAFAEFERDFETCAPDDEWQAQLDYITKLEAAADALDISTFQNLSSNTNVEAMFRTVRQAVLKFRTKLQIMNARRATGYSIKLDTESRDKLRTYIVSMRDIISKLEIPKNKREALLLKIEALSAEIERNRTRLEIVGDFAISAAAIVGSASQKLNPLRKVMDSFSKVLGEIRETQTSLPSPEEQKKIEPPKTDAEGIDENGDDESAF